MSYSESVLLTYAEQLEQARTEQSVFQTDCELLIFLLDHCTITVPPQNRFFVEVNTESVSKRITARRRKTLASLPEESGLADGMAALAFTGDYDFGHTSAEWESVIPLGIFGLRERIYSYAKQNSDTEQKSIFYQGLLSVYDAALRFLNRAANEAEACKKREMANSLRCLTQCRPTTLYEALQTSIIYYVFQHLVEGTPLRTLGRVDALFYPFYNQTPSDDALIRAYIEEIDRLKAPSNIPFAIGGTTPDGNTAENELTLAFLNTYHATPTVNTKLHILCTEQTSTSLIETAFRAIREGNNSIVFLSDSKVVESLKKQGATHTDAVRYHVVGCYECGANGELTCSCNARVNIPKALELALNDGRDILTGKQIGVKQAPVKSYEQLLVAFETQLKHLCHCAMRATDLYEAHYAQIHAAPFLSSTYTSALEKGGDLYGSHTAVYNNSSVNAIGLATAADSLMAIKQAVFEDQTVSLQEYIAILRADWKGYEPLRLLVKNKYPKFGQGDRTVDNIAVRIVDTLSATISGHPNVKGGTYRLGLFSIDWRWEFGKKTAASADGRHSGETLSQNTSATFGCDTNGATAHLLSAARPNTSKTPNGAIVDIDLHRSAVQGENGLLALVSSLKTYFSLGGFAVHYNVLDTDILKAAMEHPERYPSLQVRLCGWNVLFSSLSNAEKEEFIMRSLR